MFLTSVSADGGVGDSSGGTEGGVGQARGCLDGGGQVGPPGSMVPDPGPFLNWDARHQLQQPRTLHSGRGASNQPLAGLC